MLKIKNNSIITDKNSKEYVLLGKFGDTYKIIESFNKAKDIILYLDKKLK